MKKGLIFLAFSCIVVIFAIILSFTKSINKISNNRNIEESYDALVDVNDFDLNKFEQLINTDEKIVKNAKITTKLNDNILNVDIVGKGIKYTNEFMYADNTLYANIYGNNKIDEITYNIYDLAYSINHINLDNSITSYIKNADRTLYDLDNVGLKINDKKIVMKTDRRLNLIDFNNQYITKEFAEKYTEKLNSETLLNFGNEKIRVLKTGTKGFMIISISEKDKVTENTFKSLINILGVVLNYNNLYESFVKEHLDMKFKDEKTADYTLEINPNKEEYEKKYFEDKPMIRFTLYGK